MIVINKNTSDPHYRYKMPSLVIKHEGKNTGVKTILVNLEEISKSLSRKPEHILKYISLTLSLQVKNSVINGKHDQPKLQNIIYEFIDHFVLCYSCQNPETFFIKNGNLQMECLACGAKNDVLDHKLNTELSKNIVIPNTIYTEFLKEEEKEMNIEETYQKYKNLGLADEEIFSKLLQTYKVNELEFAIKKGPTKMILGEFEAYVEKNKKFGEISPFIDYLIEIGIKKNEISKFYSRPQSGKKRSLEFKKEINKYFSQ